MQVPPDAMTEHERFLRELIALHKLHPVLWDKNHPNNKNRTERSEATEVLLKKCREYHSDADEDFLRTKIDSLRSSFRKEHRKVVESRAKAEKPDDVYQPSLWYYKLLLYTVGEESLENMNEINIPRENANLVRIPFWSREYAALLIDFLRQNPCLYSQTHPHYCNKAKRMQALKKITADLMNTTGRIFDTHDVRRKIQLLKGQYRYECRKVEQNKHTANYKPTVWCFEMLSFLNGSTNFNATCATSTRRSLRNKTSKRKKHSSDDSDNEDQDEDRSNSIEIKNESDTETDNNGVDRYDNVDSMDVNTENGQDDFDSKKDYGDDIYDTIGKNVAHKLHQMNEVQRKIASKLISEVMYRGLMEELTPQSTLVLNNSS